jgi:putative phosphoesterase
MKIAILSDSHDHIANIEKVVANLKGKVEAAIFCGDFCAPFSARKLSELKVSIYACLGNNDEDQIGLLKLGGDKFKWTFLAEEFGTAELGGKKLAFCHYPKLADLLSKTNEYDAVFFGHTHQAGMGTHGKTLLVNPGAICGIKDGKYDEATYAIYDTSSNSAELDVIK